jgi:hypothetical protein
MYNINTILTNKSGVCMRANNGESKAGNKHSDLVDKFHKAFYSYSLHNMFPDYKAQNQQLSDELIEMVKSSSQDDIDKLLEGDPSLLQRFYFRGEVVEALIRKASSKAINQVLKLQTAEMSDPDLHLPKVAMLSNLSYKKSQIKALEALLEKGNIELILEQTRKIPHHGFLLTHASTFNDDHMRMAGALRHIHEKGNSATSYNSLYALASMTFGMHNILYNPDYISTLAYRNLETPENLFPIFASAKPSALMRYCNDAHATDVQHASLLLAAVAHLHNQGNKPGNKAALVKVLEKLNKAAAIGNVSWLVNPAFHLKMAEVLSDSSNLSLLSEKKKTEFLKNALSHAELARELAIRHDVYDPQHERAEKIIANLRSAHQGLFPMEENNARDIVSAISNKITTTNWNLKNPLVKYPDNMNLMLKQVKAMEKGSISSSAALRNIQEIAKNAASKDKYMRLPATHQFYIAMSSSKSRNEALSKGTVQRKDSLFAKKQWRKDKASEEQKVFVRRGSKP